MRFLHLGKIWLLSFATGLACSSAGEQEVAGSDAEEKTPTVVATATTTQGQKQAAQKPPGPEPTPENFKIVYPKAYISDLNPLANWSPAPDVVDYDLIVAVAANCKPPLQAYGDLTTTSQQLTTLREGVYYLCLYAIQTRGRQLEPATGPFKFTVDVTPPQVPVLDAVTAISTDTTPTFTWTKIDDADLYDIKIGTTNDCVALEDTEAAIYSYSVDEATLTTKVLPDASYYVCLIAKDFANNKTPASNNPQAFIVDTTVPTDPVAVTVPAYANATSVALTFTDSTDLNFTTHNVKACTANDCTTGCLTAFTDVASPATLTGLVDATTYYACVQGVDGAGNLSAYVPSGAGVIIDTIDPEAPTTVAITETSPYSGTSITVTFVDGTDTNFSTHNIKACTDADCTTDCVGAETDKASPATITGLLDATTYYACIQTKDAATNTSAWVASTTTITMDTTLPTDPTTVAVNGYSNSTTITTTFVDSTDTHFSTHNIKACTANDCATGCLTVTQDTASPATITSLVNGTTYYSCIQGVDTATNVSNYVASATGIVIDTVNPTDPSAITITESSPFSGTTINLTYTDGTDLNFDTHSVKACTDAACSTNCVGDHSDTGTPGAISSLLDGSTYYACIQTKDLATNTSNWVASAGTILIDTTNPTDPASVSVPLYSNSTTVSVTFTNSTDANFSTHNVKACTSNDCSTGCLTAITDAASPASLGSLVNGTAYYACVQGQDGAGNVSGWIPSAATTTIDTTNPAAPSVISISESSPFSGTTINISFTNGTDTNFDTHNVKACTDASCTTACVGATTDNATPAAIASLLDATTYYACVQSVDLATNTSSWVNSAATITIDTTNPAAPSGISVPTYSTTTSATVTFTDSTDTNFSTHNVKACTSNDCTTGCLAAIQDNASTASLGSLVNGTAYYACVQGVDQAANTSSYVPSAGTVTIDTTDPADPSGITVPTYSTATSVSVSFTNSTDTNFSTHNVKACTNNDCATGCLAAIQDASTPATLTSLVDGTAYYACVQGVDSATRTSNYVASAATVTIDTTDPAAPSGLSMAYVVNTQTVTLNYTNGSDTNFSTHNIKACTDSGCSTNCVGATTDAATPGVIGSLNYDTAYYGCAQSVDLATRTSSWVASGSTISIETPPSEPTNLWVGANAPKRVLLGWTAGGGTTVDYRIAYQTGASAPADCNSGTTIGEGSITGTEHEITGLTANTSYSFRVCGINSNGTPYYTSGVTDTIATTKTPLPGFIKIVNGQNHTCGISTENLGYCWGNDASGQLGFGAGIGEVHYPVKVRTTSAVRLTDIAAGGTNTCFLAFNIGAARCVGTDASGELGNGATTGTVDTFDVAASVVDISGLSNDRFVDIEVGDDFACGLTAGGTAYCWGSDTDERLGNGASGAQTTPLSVGTGDMTADTSLKDFKLGPTHGCGVTSDGKGYCWGNDTNERLGEGSTVTNRSQPYPISATNMGSEAPIWRASADLENSHLLTAAGKGWGAGIGTKVGDGTTTQRADYVSMDYSGVSTSVMLDITGGMSLSAGGKLFTWGNASNGQLGDGQTATNSAAAKAPNYPTGVSLYRQIGTSYRETEKCVLTGESTPYCFGDNTNGKLGTSDTSDKSAPTAVTMTNVGSHEAFLTISGHGDTFCGSTSMGRIYCWGANDQGQVGIGATSASGITSPLAIDTTDIGDTFFKDTCVGANFGMGLTIDGKIYTWGDDTYGTIGDAAGVTANAYRPTAVATTNGPYRDITCNALHACAINQSGKIYCWGEGANGRLGTGSTTDQYVPTVVDDSGIAGEKTWIDVAAGETMTCAVNSEGKGYCWGAGADGRLGAGAGTSTDQTTPVAWDETGLAGGEARFVQLTAGADFTCAKTAKGVVYCFGLNTNGRLGVGDTTLRWFPTSISRTNLDAASEGPITQVFGFHESACALTSKNVAFCWGENSNGELGDNSTTQRTSPVAVDTTLLSYPQFKALASNQSATCGIASDAKLYCWGADGAGQRGNGSTTGSTSRPPASSVDWGSEAAPTDPSGLNVVADSATQVSLSWTAGGGTTSGYRIAFKKDAATAPTDCLGQHTVGQSGITGTAHTITDLVSGTTYYFRVCSVNDDPVPDVSSGITGSVTTP